MRFWTKAFGLGVVCVLISNAGARPDADKNKAADPNAPRFDAARFLKDHDTNGDGKLSKDELPAAARDEFAQIDTNKDGFITADELQQHAALMMKQRPQLVEVIFYAIDVPEEPVSTQELQTAYDQLRKLDKNGDGKITDDEVAALRDQRKKERIDGIFEALDKNKDGKISKDEAR
ncbi:MAG TPA: EF-hand domain-containing protein, partial [Urbifossiella sp.]